MRSAIAALGVVVLGCSTSKADPQAVPLDKVADPDCKTQQRMLDSKIRSSYVAMDGASSHVAAKQLWAAMPEVCHTGAWYLAAARLVALGDKLVAGTVSIDDEAKALAGALAQPANAEVLARVALVSALGRQPALPGDACDKATGAVDTADRNANDVALYVCARTAVAAGDGKKARDSLNHLYNAKHFLDIDLVRAQAAKLVGDAKGVKEGVAGVKTIDDTRARSAFASFADVAAIKALAAKLAK